MSTDEIGCCGANCKTCKVYHQNACKGCKIGYLSGERDLTKAKCKIKVCCMAKKHSTCADCTEYDGCAIILAFHNHKGYKYSKYKQAIAFIKTNGYDAFLEISDHWSDAYGKYKTDP